MNLEKDSQKEKSIKDKPLRFAQFDKFGNK